MYVDNTEIFILKEEMAIECPLLQGRELTKFSEFLGRGRWIHCQMGVRVAKGLVRAEAGVNIFCQMGVEFYRGIFCVGAGGEPDFFHCS